MYGARLTHGKSYTGDMLKKPFSLAYNQSANVVETRYYGEHIKGVAERLGNMEKTVNIFMRNVGNIPKIGQMWDEEYYISSVKGCVVLDGIELELGLTKKFNRLSEYIGANSYKRYYEVSERMSQERRTLYKDYILITKQSGDVIPPDCFIKDAFFSSIANTFYQSKDGALFYEDGSYVPLTSEIVSSVSVQGFSKQFAAQTKVLLPVISSPLGNSMSFTWSFKDNYSAGISSVPKTNGSVSGYFGAEVTYGDYYGREYYQQFSLQIRKEGITLSESLALPNDFNKSGTLEVLGNSDKYYKVLRKDNRERLNQSYSVEFVTDIKNLIIGSALSRNNPIIGGVIEKAGAALYVFPERINQFSTDELDLSTATKVYDYSDDLKESEFKNQQIYITATGGTWLTFRGLPAPVSGKAWAIVTNRYQGETYLAENEDGVVEPVTPQYGGELLLAYNGEISEGEEIGKFNMTAVHDIFETINKEKTK